jgi:hypothetical protein
MHRAFLNRDVPLPAVASFRGSAGTDWSRRRSWGSCPFAVLFLHGGYPGVSARLSPHAVSELPPRRSFFFSRDRPTDILFRGSGEIAWPPPRRFTHCKLKLGRSRKFTSASGSLSATQSALPPLSARRRDPALGLASFRSVGHHSGAPARPRNTHEPSVSARPLPACYPLLGFVAIISQMHRSLFAACIRCIAGPSASSRD